MIFEKIGLKCTNLLEKENCIVYICVKVEEKKTRQLRFSANLVKNYIFSFNNKLTVKRNFHLVDAYL